jgi:hypothetical protein
MFIPACMFAFHALNVLYDDIFLIAFDIIGENDG